MAGNEGDTPYYTNSSHLPVGYTEDIFTALDIQDELQILYTSGTVFHAFWGEKLPDRKSAAALVKEIAKNYKLPYYTLSSTYSICKDHGYIAGEHFLLVARLLRFTAGSLDITVQYRTGTMEKSRNIKTGPYTIGFSLH